MQGGDRRASHGYDAFLVALADHGHKTGLQVQLLQAEVAQFGQTQTRGVGQFQESLIAEAGRRFRGDRFEQALDFFLGERFGQPLPPTGQRQVFGDVNRQVLFDFAKPVEGAQGCDLQVNTFRAERAGRSLRGIGGLAGSLVLQKGHQMRQLDGFPVADALSGRPGYALAEQGLVGFLGLLGLAPLVTQVLQKIFDELLHTRHGIVP